MAPGKLCTDAKRVQLYDKIKNRVCLTTSWELLLHACHASAHMYLRVTNELESSGLSISRAGFQSHVNGTADVVAERSSA